MIPHCVRNDIGEGDVISIPTEHNNDLDAIALERKTCEYYCLTARRIIDTRTINLSQRD